MIWLIATLSLLIYAPIAEYAIHRWVMHSPHLGRGTWWTEHAVEHHGRRRNDINIDIDALSVLFAASPLLLFAGVLGWPWVVAVLLACIAYAALWSSLHAAHHGIRGSWTTRLGIHPIWLHHHQLHHQNPRTNFGTVFIFTDVVFRTQCPPAQCEGNTESAA